MTEQEQTKPKPARLTWVAGTKWRVIQEGGYLDGMVSQGRSAWGGWRQTLHVGDVIECDGIKNGWGGDPVPEAMFHNDASVAAGSGWTAFKPQIGMWQAWPVDGYLELVPEVTE